MEYAVEEYLDVELLESPKLYKRVQVWTDGETRKLLDLYSNYMAEIGPLKKFRTKKDMWASIASEISGKTAKQCEERYKTVLRRKKLVVDNNNASGSKRKAIEFEDEIAKISLRDDSIEPDIQISADDCIRANKNEKFEPKPRKKSKTIQETLLEISKEKEEARERRHKEKMELLKKILQNNEDL